MILLAGSAEKQSGAELSLIPHRCLQFCVGTIKDDYLGVISQAAGIV